MSSLLFKREIKILGGFGNEIIGYDTSSMLVIGLNQIVREVLSYPFPMAEDVLINKLNLSGFDIKEILPNIEVMKKLKIISKEQQSFKSIMPCIADCSNKETKIGGLVLNICHECNMRCNYCFAGGGNYGMKKESMSKKR